MCYRGRVQLTINKVFMKQTLRLLPLLCTIFTATPAFALHEVYSPKVEKGEFELEYIGARFGDESGSALNNAQEHEIEIGYGFTDNLNVALLVEGERESGEAFHVAGYGTKVRYEATEQGDWWLGSGILGEYVYTPHHDDADEFKLALLLERTQGPWNAIVNLIGEPHSEWFEHFSRNNIFAI